MIPEDFKGVVYVIYDKQIGDPKVFEELSRVYNIPNTGVLFTQFEQTSGIHHRKFFYVTKNGKRKELGVLDYRDFNEEYTNNPKINEPPRDSLAVFTPEISVDVGTKYYYTTFTVGQYQHIKVWNFLYPDVIDSLRKVKAISSRTSSHSPQSTAPNPQHTASHIP